jgi:hypothetical protein
LWFAVIRRKWFSCCCATKFACPGADISEDHKSSGSGIPAFPYVGTITAGADGMKMVFFDEMFYPGIILPAGPLHLKPFR